MPITLLQVFESGPYTITVQLSANGEQYEIEVAETADPTNSFDLVLTREEVSDKFISFKRQQENLLKRAVISGVYQLGYKAILDEIDALP